MVVILAFDRMATISISHPYSVSSYKVMVSNVISVKYHGCGDSYVHPYAFLRDYIFGGSDVRPYVNTSVRPYGGTFQHQRQLVYS